MRRQRSSTLTLASLALLPPLCGSCATASLWQGDVAWNRDFELRAEELLPVDVRGIRQVNGDLVLSIDSDQAAGALAGWAPPGGTAVLALRLPPGSPTAALFGDLPMLDTTRFEVRAIGRKPPPEGGDVLSLRARCELSGVTRDPRFVARLEEQHARYGEEAWMEPAPGLLGVQPKVRCERASVFEPAHWSVVEFVDAELLAPGDSSRVAGLRPGLAPDLAMAPVAPPDPSLILLFKVAATPLALAVDACTLVLVLFASGAPAPVAGG